jgi:hypothetical protein
MISLLTRRDIISLIRTDLNLKKQFHATTHQK